MSFIIDGTDGLTFNDSSTQLTAGLTGSTSQLCKAWVNFNGTGTVAIRASYNVSSITDNGTGDYTVNFTTAMPDTNYAVGGLMQPTVTNNGSDSFAAYTLSSVIGVNLIHFEDGLRRDSNWVSCIIFR